jgi:hypothetical protein
MTSRRRFIVPAAFLAALAVAAGCGSPASPTSANSTTAVSTLPAAPAIEITIDVAPNVLNIQSAGEVVTVHTSLAYGSVAASSVTMNGVTISGWKADNQGDFVAKFLMEAIKNLPLKIGDYNTLRIEGQTTKGSSFWGSQAILVVNNVSGK